MTINPASTVRRQIIKYSSMLQSRRLTYTDNDDGEKHTKREKIGKQ